jgi:hypothetical protein
MVDQIKIQNALLEMCKRALGDEITVKIYEDGPRGFQVVYQQTMKLRMPANE